MKIFLDVGAHYGETIEEVVKKKYNFDLIYAFEPSKKCLPELEKYKSQKVIINNYGLGEKTENRELYSSGNLGANIYKNYEHSVPEKIKICKASDWFKENIKEKDIVFVKLNCEGSECEIINDLLQSNQFEKIYNVMITFDVREIPGKENEEIKIRKELKKNNSINYCFADNVMVGENHQKRISNWLSQIGGDFKSYNKELLLLNYKFKLQYLSSKSGILNRFEYKIKKIIFYKNYPNFIKKILQKIKYIMFNTK